MNIKKPNSFARCGNDYVAPLTTIDQIVKPSGERYTNKDFELMSNVENVMFGENCAGKNLLRPTLQTYTVDGLTLTNNGDETYTLSGTGLGYRGVEIGKANLTKGKTYKIVGQNINGRVWLDLLNNNYEVVQSHRDIRNDFTFNVSSNGDYYFKIGAAPSEAYSGILKPMLTDDLSATYDDFEPYVKSLKQLTDSAWNIDLLWTNASPTSAFAEQTISLDLSKYKSIGIISKLSAEEINYTPMQFINLFNSNVKTFIGMFLTLPNGYSRGRTRGVIVTKNSIHFEEGYNSSGFSGQTVDNGYCIPYQIYGVR